VAILPLGGLKKGKPSALSFAAPLVCAALWWGCASTPEVGGQREAEPQRKAAPADTASFQEKGVDAYPAVVVNRRINLRKGPGTNYEIVSKLSGGQAVTVVTTSGEWVKVLVDRDNQMGWLHASLIRRKR